MTARHYRKTRGFGQLFPTQLVTPAMTAQAAMGAANAQANANANALTNPDAIPTRDLSTGNVIDCASIWNFANSACLGFSPSGQPLTPSGAVDCSQFQNYINGSCSLLDFAGANPLGTGISLGVVAIGALILIVLVKI